MARVRSQDYDAVKQSILDCAAALFARKGFASTSIKEISEAAGFTKAGVYHYFESKNELLRTILIDHLEVVSEIIDTALNTSESPRSKFITCMRLLINCYIRPGSRDQHTVLMRELDSLSAKDREFIIATERRMIRLIEKLLKSIHPKLEEQQDFARPLAMFFFGMINWTDTWYSEKGLLNPDELATLAGEFFLNGLEHTKYSDVPTRR